MPRAIDLIAAVTLAASVYSSSAAFAEKKYDPGASDTEIKIGNTTPYSGPVSVVQTTAKAEAAYFEMINSRGGINGRKIKFISLDDGYSPPKALEQTRKLVESDGVLGMFATPGTPPNLAVQKYLNQRGIPQLLIGSGAAVFDDPKNFPWSAPFTPSIDMEGRIYGEYISQAKPNPKIAVLYQNDDFGKGLYAGLKASLGAKASTLIVKDASYEVSDPTVDSQVVSLQSSGADVFVFVGTPKFGAQAIRKAYDLGWHPLRVVNWASSSVSGTLQPAGLDKSVGLMTGTIFKSPNDPALADDQDVKDYIAFLKKWYPEASPADVFVVQGYIQAQLMVMMLERCGDELTRKNLMKQALSFKDTSIPMMMPGVRINIRSGSMQMFHEMQMVRFDGRTWVKSGDVLRAK